MQKTATYQTWFNLEKPNTYKENKSPWQLAQEKRPDLPKEALMLPPVDLDALLNEKLDLVTQGGYDVSSVPYSWKLEGSPGRRVTESPGRRVTESPSHR